MFQLRQFQIWSVISRITVPILMKLGIYIGWWIFKNSKIYVWVSVGHISVRRYKRKKIEEYWKKKKINWQKMAFLQICIFHNVNAYWIADRLWVMWHLVSHCQKRSFQVLDGFWEIQSEFQFSSTERRKHAP